MLSVRRRLAEIVKESSEPHSERRAGVSRGLHDREDVLVERQVLPFAVLLETDRLLELGQKRDEHARVAGKPQCPRRLRAEQELRELAHPVRAEPAPDALAGDERDARGFGAHLLERLRVRLETELRDEPQAPHETQWILGEATRPNRAKNAVLQIRRSAEWIDHLPRLQSASPSRSR